MSNLPLTRNSAIQRLAWWQWAWILLAITSLPPVCYTAYQALQITARDLSVQLIQRYSLWETDPLYRGTPQSWTRFAAILLNTDQLMERVREKQGALGDQIEDDFKRDAALAYAGVVTVYMSMWAIPIALLYAAGWIYQRRRNRGGHRNL